MFDEGAKVHEIKWIIKSEREREKQKRKDRGDNRRTAKQNKKRHVEFYVPGHSTLHDE